jgi:hypothetical protein
MFNTVEKDGWISLGYDIPSTSLNLLYIRDCYRSIESSINRPGINKAIITGTPGRGKSLFLVYLLWKLVNERQRVLFIYHPFHIDRKGGIFMLENLPSAIHILFWNETLWCLFDSKFKTKADLCKLPVGICSFIISTSPRREMVNDFKKPPEPDVFYMPIWSENEVKKISPLFLNAKDLGNRFKILGRIPRNVFESKNSESNTS